MSLAASIAELRAIHNELTNLSAALSAPDFTKPLMALDESAKNVGKAWSGSWLGYQSQVYYKDLQPPPAGAHFSVEWGFDVWESETQGEWQEFTVDEIRNSIIENAGSPDISECQKVSEKYRASIEEKRDEIASILRAAQHTCNDLFLSKLIEEAEGARPLTEIDFLRRMQSSREIMSRDRLAVGQGLQIPTHIGMLAKVAGILAPQTASHALANIARKAISHLERLAKQEAKVERIGTNVFIGHGRSKEWKDLKDFISDRMRLPWDEFNRVPVAGIPNTVRLATMLDAAAIAFLVLTGEDEARDGAMQARMNVVHEAGLFQGRLGFTRAIVMLEEGCQEFSNIEGLGQIRFPKDNIKAAFHEVELVLEREGLSEPPGK